MCARAHAAARRRPLQTRRRFTSSSRLWLKLNAPLPPYRTSAGVHLFAVRTEPPILAVVPRQKFWTQNLHGVIGAPASSIRPCVTLLIIALFARMIYGQKLPFLRSICCTIRCKVCSRCRFLLLFLPRTCTCFSGSTESTFIVSNTTCILNFKHQAHFVCKREDGHCSYGFPSVLVRFGILKPKHREKCASWRHGVCTNG